MTLSSVQGKIYKQNEFFCSKKTKRDVMSCITPRLRSLSLGFTITQIRFLPEPILLDRFYFN